MDLCGSVQRQWRALVSTQCNIWFNKMYGILYLVEKLLTYELSYSDILRSVEAKGKGKRSPYNRP